MSTTLLIIVLLLGVTLLTLEIVVLPGGVAGAFGVALIAVGVWQSYAVFGSRVGTIILICAAFASDPEHEIALHKVQSDRKRADRCICTHIDSALRCSRCRFAGEDKYFSCGCSLLYSL